FVQEFRGLEEIVFVILLDDAKLFGIGERTEMHGGGIHGGGDVHEFQTKRAGGKREVADVADERDVGIVDRDVEVGLIVQSGGLKFLRKADPSLRLLAASWRGKTVHNVLNRLQQSPRHYREATGFQVRPPSVVSKTLVLPRFQTVA